MDTARQNDRPVWLIKTRPQQNQIELSKKPGLIKNVLMFCFHKYFIGHCLFVMWGSFANMLKRNKPKHQLTCSMPSRRRSSELFCTTTSILTGLFVSSPSFIHLDGVVWLRKTTPGKSWCRINFYHDAPSSSKALRWTITYMCTFSSKVACFLDSTVITQESTWEET